MKLIIITATLKKTSVKVPFGTIFRAKLICDAFFFLGGAAIKNAIVKGP